MREVLFVGLFIALAIMAWRAGFLDGRQVERDVLGRAHRRQVEWLKAELRKAHEVIDTLERGPHFPATESPWDPDQEPDYE